MLELALLGNPELHLAGQPLGRLRSAKAYGLLYYLAVTRRAQPRTVLAGLFWGDVDDTYARRNFNRTLSDLNQFVGDHLVVERQAVAFAHSQPHWLDVAVLETAATTVPTPQTVTTLAAAANLYRADFLDGFYVQEAPEFEQWVLRERGRLRTNALQLHETLSHYYAQLGELLPAMDHARRMLQLEPWREEAHRQLMLLLAQSGQRSAALAQYELCRQALSSELAVEPDATTLELVAQIRGGGFDQRTRRDDDRAQWAPARRQDDKMTAAVVADLSQSAAPLSHPVILSSGGSPLGAVIPHNLPPQRTPFIGRAAELADITRLLVADEDCRLLTLLGPGGMGKTRLAIKLAEAIVATPELSASFSDGIFFVSLEHVRDADGLAAAVIAAISEDNGQQLQGNAPLTEQLRHFLRNKAMVLILDNFEHLVSHAAFCSKLLATAPKVKLLVTTRETLGLQEAWLYPLLGLAFPHDAPEQTAPPGDYDAVRLFAQCARRTRPDFVLATEWRAVVHICRLLEGMPLGIELAAAWLKMMTCEQIAQEITHGLDFLTARYQNIPARHRSMRAVMDHSWALLTADEGEAIARLSIFRGRFRQEAADTITGTSLFTLATLVEKALVRVTADGHYQLHELTRQYAEERLTSTTRSALRDAHAIYYAALLSRQKPLLFTQDHRRVWATVGGEFDNIRQAWAWLIDAVRAERHDLPVTSLLRQMAEVFANYYLFHSLGLPGQALFANVCQILEAAGWANPEANTDGQASAQATLVHLQLLTGLFHFELGHYRISLAMAEQALATYRALASKEDLLLALLLYGRTQMRRGARAEAAIALQEALTLGRQLGSRHNVAEALLSLGMVASGEGRYADAQQYYQQGLTLCQALGYRAWVARTLINLGSTYSRQLDYRQALPYFEQALTIAKEEGHQRLIMISTSDLGYVQRGFGNYPSAIDYYQRSLEMARKIGDERWIAANLNGLAITYLAMGELTGAERSVGEGLAVGHQSESTRDSLGSIGLFGHLLARRGQLEKALKVLAFVEQHPATMAHDRSYNQPLLTELRSELPPRLFDEAAAWAREQTLDSVVQWLR